MNSNHEEEEDKYDLELKYVILGDSSVGKSAIVNRFFENNFIEDQNYTIGVSYHWCAMKTTKSQKKLKLKVWDTAGQERFRSITSQYYRSSHGIFIVYDITNRQSFENVNYWLQEIDKHLQSSDVVVVLIGNKSDLKDSREVLTEEGMEIAHQRNLIFFECSAKENKNVKCAFHALSEECVEKNVARQLLRKNKKKKKNEEEVGKNYYSTDSIYIRSVTVSTADRLSMGEGIQQCCF